MNKRKIIVLLCSLILLIGCQNPETTQKEKKTVVLVFQEEGLIKKNFESPIEVPGKLVSLFKKTKKQLLIPPQDLNKRKPIEDKYAEWLHSSYFKAMPQPTVNNYYWPAFTNKETEYEFYPYGKINMKENIESVVVIMQPKNLPSDSTLTQRQLILLNIKENKLSSLIYLSAGNETNNNLGMQVYFDKERKLIYFSRKVGIDPKTYFSASFIDFYHLDNPVWEKRYVYSFQLNEEGYIEKVNLDFTPWQREINGISKWEEWTGRYNNYFEGYY